jgi:PAS domain S-box-containing protein
VGCLYVTHRQVAGLFGVEDERLADFIATLGGAALENAEGFAELQRLNQTLEHRIAESRRAEKRIQQQAALLDKARDAISVQDLDDHIRYWNQSAENLYGWTAAEAIGRKDSELLFRGPSPQFDEAARQLLARGEWTGELRQVTRAGQEIIVESRWSLVRDDAGRPRARLVVNTDITEKKKLEAQFLRAQRLESLGTLAGGIAHDLNNILTPIVMGVDMLRMNLAETQRSTILRQVESCAQRGAEMVKQILSFARGAGGQRVHFQVRRVVLEIEKMLTGTLPKSIEIRTVVPRDLLMVCGDVTQLSQLLMNLCVNARDAMPQGGRLTVSAANTLLQTGDPRLPPDGKPGPYVNLTVEDTGTGIPPDVLDKIFDPFFTTKEFGKGTGLGLSTVLGIVKGHGGFIHVVSMVGVGSQFSVYLPAAPSEERPEGVEASGRQYRGAGELILVIDDEAIIRQMAQEKLEALGYRVLTASNGQEALPLYEAHRKEIALVLTDMMMPAMDGLATLQALRQRDPELRVIAVSGLSASREEIAAAGLTIQGFLPKPFTADQLLRAIQEALQGGKVNG